MSAVLDHARRNLVGYIALFVALGGTSYAAFTQPAGSVNGRAIQNHVIDPVKFDPKLINGSVRAWAEVDAGGRVLAGGGRPRVGVAHIGIPGLYNVRWRVASLARCAPIGSVDGRSLQAGFVLAAVNGPGLRRVVFDVVVSTFDAHGQRAALPFNVAVIC